MLRKGMARNARPSMLDAVKIQARIVIPIVKALERDLGKERAHAIVGQAIANAYADWQGARTSVRNSHPRDDNASGAFPVETEVVDDTESAFGVNMTRCQFAEYFRHIGEPEIGALLTCGVDFVTQAKLRPEWEFARTQTLMKGAPYCDFRWRLKPPA
jgi:L-2-amino-thiazoline-4-carboxylic acid hydrolase